MGESIGCFVTKGIRMPSGVCVYIYRGFGCVEWKKLVYVKEVLESKRKGIYMIFSSNNVGFPSKEAKGPSLDAIPSFFNA